MDAEPKEFLDTVVARLANDGFSVQRSVQAVPYTLDILASRSLEKKVMWGGTSIPWSEVVAVSLMEIRCPDDARNYSSFLAKYVLKNRHSLHTRWNDLTTVAVIVSSSFGNDTKQWVFETTPEYSEMWARAEFPVLVDLGNREIIYPRKGSPGNGPLFENLRYLSDEWFGFSA